MKENTLDSGIETKLCLDSAWDRWLQHVYYAVSSDSEYDVIGLQEEIPMLCPGQFGRSGFWREFLKLF